MLWVILDGILMEIDELIFVHYHPLIVISITHDEVVRIRNMHCWDIASPISGDTVDLPTSL